MNKATHPLEFTHDWCSSVWNFILSCEHILTRKHLYTLYTVHGKLHYQMSATRCHNQIIKNISLQNYFEI